MRRDLDTDKPRTDLIDCDFLSGLVYNYDKEKYEVYVNYINWFKSGDNNFLICAINLACKCEGISIYSFVERFGNLLRRGALKYGENNWQLANSVEEMDRFKKSSHRHFCQWLFGEKDEDHLVAGLGFNPSCFYYVSKKINERPE